MADGFSFGIFPGYSSKDKTLFRGITEPLRMPGRNPDGFPAFPGADAGTAALQGGGSTNTGFAIV